jgi:hypothetical protein
MQSISVGKHMVKKDWWCKVCTIEYCNLLFFFKVKKLILEESDWETLCITTRMMIKVFDNLVVVGFFFNIEHDLVAANGIHYQL